MIQGVSAHGRKTDQEIEDYLGEMGDGSLEERRKKKEKEFLKCISQFDRW